MTKLEELESQITLIPAEFYWIKHALTAQLESCNLERMMIYALGLYHMAEALTSDDAILNPIRKIREILK